MGSIKFSYVLWDLKLALSVYLGFTALQDYFTNFKPRQLLGGAKTKRYPKRHLTTCKQSLAGLSHVILEGLKPTAL